jgi:uncharacterized membrane protein
MAFWFYMLFVSLIIPVTMALIGMVYRKKCPRNINMVLGYRTRRSMMNQRTWAFAHAYCGRIWLWSGLAMLPISLAAMLCVWGRDVHTVGCVGAALCVLPILVMIGSAIATERALKRNFDSIGRPIRKKDK